MPRMSFGWRRLAIAIGLVSAAFVGAGNVAAASATTGCTAEEVAVFANRIYVRCAAAVGGVSIFALPTTDAPHAARMLSLLSTAHVAGRAMTLIYETDAGAGGNFGCPPTDCRLLLGARFGK